MKTLLHETKTNGLVEFRVSQSRYTRFKFRVLRGAGASAEWSPVSDEMLAELRADGSDIPDALEVVRPAK